MTHEPSLPEVPATLTPALEACTPGEPHTSSEIAERLGCARTTAYKKLQELADLEVLRTKKVGARGRVWWLPAKGTVLPQGDTEDDGDPGDPGDDAESDVPGDGDIGTVRRRERLCRAVFEESFDAILIADDEARYVDANPAACELFGLSREDLLGRTIAEFAPESYPVEAAWQRFREFEQGRGLFPLVCADGERLLVEFAATRNVLPGRHLSVIRDVTKRQETRAELAAAREQSREYRRTLAADTLVETEIHLPDAVFGRLSTRLGCTCTFEGVVSAVGGRYLQYVTVSGASPDAVLSAAAEFPAVVDCDVVHEAESEVLCRFELVDSPIESLVELGGVCRSMRSESGLTKLVAEFGGEADVPEKLAAFRGAYPDATLATKRTLDRPVTTAAQHRDSFAGRLTERQLETLRAAHHAGYFEWPRTSTAEEVASSMGVASSTWLRHLRLGEQAYAQWLFETLGI